MATMPGLAINASSGGGGGGSRSSGGGGSDLNLIFDEEDEDEDNYATKARVAAHQTQGLNPLAKRMLDPFGNQKRNTNPPIPKKGESWVDFLE